MQGHWLSPDGEKLVVDGFDVTYRGQAVRHDHFTVEQQDGALVVDLGVDDASRKDSFQRENVTGLVIDPDGEFHAFNTRFGSSFERVEQ